MSGRLEENGLVRLNTRTAVNLNAAPASDMSLYEVPSGKNAIVTQVIIRSVSADALLAVVTFGRYLDGNCDQWLSDITLAALDATDKVGIINKGLSDLTILHAQDLLVAGDEFGVQITTAAGAGSTCTMDTFGYEFDA